jgi:cytochrome P450
METAAQKGTLKGLPVVKGVPLFGSFFDFRNHRIELQLKTRAQCGDLGVVKIGPISVVAISSAELAQEVLVERAADFKKSKGLSRYARPIIGNGLLSSEGEEHRRNRKLMAPAFQHKRIAGWANVMAEFGESAAARWKDGERIDVAEEMMRLTLAIVGRTLFDADVESDANDVAEALPLAMKWMLDTVSMPLRLPYPIPTPHNLRLKSAVEKLDAIVYRIIRERRASDRDRGDALSMLLAAVDEEDGSRMSDRQLRDEVMTLILAGHETTANALAWTFHLLGRHPAIADEVRAEADRVLGGRTATFDDLARMPFGLQVLKESMRLHPPAYMVGREALRPVTLGGRTFPAGTNVFVNIYAMHRRADYFPDPDRFDPSRFTPENEKRIPRGAWLPFGGGPRVCIGNHFALMEGHVLLATLAQRVRFEPLYTGDIAPEPLVTLRPRGGVPMKVVRRAPRN